MKSQQHRKDKITKVIKKKFWRKHFTTHNISGCNTHPYNIYQGIPI